MDLQDQIIVSIQTFTVLQQTQILAGLIDSDGCIGWTWTTDGAFMPSIYVTQKKNLQVLDFLKEWFGGNVTKTNGNWTMRSMTRVQGSYLGWLFSSNEKDVLQCYLVTSRRFDGLLLHIAMGYCSTKFHKKKEGKAILIHFRVFLHGGSTTSFAKTPAELCECCKVPEGIYAEKEIEARSLVATAMKDVRQHKNYVRSILNSGVFSLKNCIPPYQVVGFFLGDGGMHVVWGSKIMTTTLTWTGDRASAHALEFYSWSLFCDGVYRKAWKSKKRNVSRLILNGVENFSNHITPFFQKNPLPPCEKTTILVAILETAEFLSRLKTKTIWSDHDFKELSILIRKTWYINSSGPSRKYGTPENYIAHVKEQYESGGFRIA